jgi:hypothetical protein
MIPQRKPPDVQISHTFYGFLEPSGVVETSKKR